MFFILGVLDGLLREFLVICWFQSIQQRLALRGSGISLVIGLLDFGVIAKLALDRNILMMIGYIIGETVGTFVGIQWSIKKK